MAIIDELLEQVQDINLRDRIKREVDILANKKKFGLVYEEHLPECTPLYDIPVKVGSLVAEKTKIINELFYVESIKDDIATCRNKKTQETTDFGIEDIISIAEFGDPIYPYLKEIDLIENAPDSELWHTLIEADNYHALQLLEYLYAGKVDCIYIDPPYNTGARDWKYNNDYVDGNDSYRHSKWLSMMNKRLSIAKNLLNPKDSVLIVTIDEKEYLHLGCLLEEMFPNAKIQMISSVISQKGVIRVNEFSRVNEFVFFVMIGDYSIKPFDEAAYIKEGDSIHWQTFRRSDFASRRGTTKGGVAQFYPIYVNDKTKKIEKIGDAISPEEDRFLVPQLSGCTAVFPVRDDGTEMNWGVVGDEAKIRAKKGYIRATKFDSAKPQPYVIQYLMGGTIKDIEDGLITVIGYNPDGSIIAKNNTTKKIPPKTQWDNKYHDARDYGSKILKSILGTHKFDFPKSLYAVKDCLKYFVADKPNALVLDFFAGSGTTLHAVNLLNAEDGGNRRCIMVTNNEVSEKESEAMKRKGLQPGDEEWEQQGIARHVTWPRTTCTIKGQNIQGEYLNGKYIESDISMSDGFKTNAVYFKLGFLDKTKVALGTQFKELLPLLWMKAGAVGKCPKVKCEIPDYLILSKNKMAILINEERFSEFFNELIQDEIDTVYFVTDSELGYKEMISFFEGKDTYQIYRDYLDNFRINAGGKR